MQNTRFVSILLAIAVPVSAWIGLEFLASKDLAAQQPVPAAATQPSVSPSSKEDAPAPVEPLKLAQAGAGGIHKCVSGGVVTYTDQPCAQNAVGKRIEVKTNTAGLAPARSFQSQVAPEQSSQVEAPAPAATTAARDPEAEKRAACKQIDVEIKAIDDRLRQPYYPQEGDYLKAQRKGLTDRRFSVGC